VVTALVVIIGLAICTPVAVAVLLDLHGQRSFAPGPYDAIVVAGCRVRPDGRPTDALRRRAKKGAELYLAGLAPKLVLTGGAEPGRRAEAEVAAEVCSSMGIPEAALIREASSRNTLQNAARAAELVSGRVLVVSDGYHTWRCRRIFRKHFDSVETAGSTPALRPRIRHAVRELGSIAEHLWKGQL